MLRITPVARVRIMLHGIRLQLPSDGSELVECG